MKGQEEGKKKDYLIAKALHKFMWASILASMASQIAMTTDAIVVSQFIGPEAISAVNLTMPVVIFFNFLMMLFGMGGSVLVARSLGERDAQTTNYVFTSTLIGLVVVGVFFSSLLLFFSPQVASFITNDTPVVYTLSLRYLRIMLLGTTITILFMTITNFIKTDGNPQLVMRAVLVSSLVNLIFDILFIVILKTGIEGSAWASIIGTVTALLLCSRHFRSANNSYHWQVELKQCHEYILKGVKMGFPMGINTLLLGISTYAINSIILSSLGTDGIFAWAICFQLFVIQQMVLGGIATSIYSIGGLLIGEKDIVGLRLLTNKVMKYICLSLLVITLFVMVTPESIGWLFASKQIQSEGMLYSALRIYALLLIPYAIAVVYRILYQILGYWSLSVVMSIVQMGGMILFVGLLAWLNPEWLWWGFPVSGLFLLGVYFVVTWVIHHRNPEAEVMTLIPQAADAQSLNFSVKYQNEDVQQALENISMFLESCDIEPATSFQINLCCEELMYNIVTYAVNKDADKHLFDVHIVCHKETVSVLIKDDGKPFNPILKTVSFNEDGDGLGLALVNTMADMKYKFMYNQNVVFLTFKREQTM
jgi:Na+-driven multidrug efflux pump/anti-sigma regulatory factor (Ser/Thr protein kinase)